MNIVLSTRKKTAAILVGLAVITLIVTRQIMNENAHLFATIVPKIGTVIPEWTVVPRTVVRENVKDLAVGFYSKSSNETGNAKKGTGYNSTSPNTSSPKSIRNTTQATVLVHRCKCHLTYAFKSDVIIPQYASKIPWLNDTTLNYLDRRHPNWPSLFLFERMQSKSCHLVPTEFKIEWRNTYWQEATLSNDSKILLYSASYDSRKTTNLGPCVRLLGVSLSVELPKAWCHLWFDLKNPPVVSEVVAVEHIDYQKKDHNHQMPYLLTCNIPKDVKNLLPKAVSLVSKPCIIASNILKVNGAKERVPSAYTNKEESRDPRDLKGHSPAVCGTALYYYHEDFSIRIVEWLEMLRALEFGKVYMHLTSAHPNIEKVLRHYEKEGFVSITMYSYPPPYFNEPSTRRMWTMVERNKMFAQENVYFTDCLLRHMHQHRFIAHYDPDEVPVVPKHRSYTHFLDELLKTSSSDKKKKSGSVPLPPAYQLQWRFFYDDIKPTGAAAQLPEYLWILRHIKRPTKDIKLSPGKLKSLYDMDVVRGVYSHGVLFCVTGKCEKGMKRIPLDYAYLGHFNRMCGNACKGNGTTTEEPTLHRYKEKVSREVKKVLEKLELMPKQTY